MKLNKYIGEVIDTKELFKMIKERSFIMEKKYGVLTTGYVSLDHIINIKTPAKVGFTSLVENDNCTEINFGGCSLNIAYGLCKLGIKSAPIFRVGKDFEKSGLKKFLTKGKVPLEGITKIDNANTSKYLAFKR